MPPLTPPISPRPHGPSSGAGDMSAWVAHYLAHLRDDRGMSAHTVSSYGHDLGALARFLAGRDRVRVEQVDAADLLAFVAHLEALGRKPASQARAISATRQCFLFALREGLIAVSPAKKLRGPKWARQAPQVGSPDAIRALIAACHQTRHAVRRLRDIAILELLYGAGLRASEACGLLLADLDAAAGLVTARGHGGRQRLVPIGGCARAALARYLGDGRPHIKGAASSAYVFVSRRGRPLSRMALYTLVRQMSLRVPRGQRLSPHALRHACATHLLHNGADLRIVQQMLGHQSILTTQGYTQVAPGSLAEAVERHHPLGAAGAAAHPAAAKLLRPLARASKTPAVGDGA